MTNQKIENNPVGLSVVERRVAERLEEQQEEQEETVKVNNSKDKSGKRTMFRGDTIVRGIMWHEILSDPLCKRRRSK